MYKPDEINNLNLLSSYLRTSPDTLKTFVYGKAIIIDIKEMTISSNTKEGYMVERFYIPKKNLRMGYRIVYKLKQQSYVDILKVLKFNLDNIYHPLDCVHGFVKNRNTYSNAKNHLGKKYLLKLDIKDFFESISYDFVRNVFIFLGFQESIANHLSKITTLDDKLVQGYPTSPILANIACVKMDNELIDICKKYNAKYTRYADDISISSDNFFNQKSLVKDVLLKYGFKLNENKSQRFKQGQNQYVTGLSIADKKSPRIPRHIKKRIRQQLHYLKLYGYHSHICYINGWDERTDESVTSELSHKLSNVLKGWIDYINPIEPDLAKQFYEIYNLIEQVELKKKEKKMEKIHLENNGIIEITFEQHEPILKKS